MFLLVPWIGTAYAIKLASPGHYSPGMTKEASQCEFTFKVEGSASCLQTAQSLNMSSSAFERLNSWVNCSSPLSPETIVCSARDASSLQTHGDVSPAFVTPSQSFASSSPTIVSFTGPASTEAPTLTAVTPATLPLITTKRTSVLESHISSSLSVSSESSFHAIAARTSSIFSVAPIPSSSTSTQPSQSSVSSTTEAATMDPSPSPSRIFPSSTPDAPIQVPSSGDFVVSWNWFAGPTSDCFPEISADQYNRGFYAGAEDGLHLCGQTGTFTYQGNSVTITYAWKTTGGVRYHEISPTAFAKLIGSNAQIGSQTTPQQFQAAINDPGRVTASCTGVC